ncbi:MAG TPA: carbohydrate ABC transporter permease [Roseiflexaceae bacterium]|nr:carbohydrate ABC transporter permease [Roseiflexaceae bacterium]
MSVDSQAQPVTLRATGRRAQASPRQITVQALKYFILAVLTLTWLFPFYWMFTSALKNDPQVYTIPPVLVPNPAFWENFPNAWTKNNFTLFALNTIFRYALPATILTVVSSGIVAYGFSRIRWPGRDALFYICLATIILPWQVTMVPLFITFKNLGWLNSYLPLVVPSAFGNAFFIFMMRQFFLSIPEELSDAARIDGASEFGILLRIILPLAVPALAVVALFRFLGAWNDFLGPLIYLNKEELYPLALGINRLRASISATGTRELAYPYLMAVSTIVVSPILILFFLAQRTFIEGISVTGIKG